MSRPGRVRDTELVAGRRKAQVGSYRGKKPPGNASPAQATRDKISDAKVRKKPDKLVLTLAKETAYSWHDLKK